MRRTTASTTAEQAHNNASTLPPRDQSVLPHIIALLTYGLLAIIATWPLVLHMTTHLPTMRGEMGQDVWQNSWNVWWVQHALLHKQSNPYTTPMLFYPQGASLYLHSLILPLGIIGTPLVALFGILPAYNLLTLLVFAAGGYTTFLLARWLTNHPPAALLAGAIVMYSPQRLFELRGAQMATLNDYAVPLALLSTLLLLKRRTWSLALLAAAMLLLNGLNKWYHLFHMLLILAILFLWQTIAAWRSGKQPALLQELRPWAMLALSTTLLLLPFLLPALREALTTTYAQKSDELVISADLLQLIPPSIGGIWQSVPADWWYTHLFAYTPLLLALGGLWLAPRQTLLWATLALLLFILSLGPALRIGNTETAIPLPYALFRHIPVLDIFRAPIRMNMVVTLMLALIAAYGIQQFTRRKPPLLQWGTAGLLITLLAIETLRLPFPLVNGMVSPFYQRIASEPGEWTMLELPFDRADREVLEMYQQTHHHKPILTGRPARSVPGIPYRYAPPIAQIDAASRHPDIISMPAETRRQLLRALRIRYLVLHHPLQTPQKTAAQLATARQLLGSLTATYSDTHLRAYRLDETAAWLDHAGQSTREPVPLFIGLDRQWEPPEPGGYGNMRWLPPDGAGVWIYTPTPRRVVLDLSLYSIAGSGPLEIRLNGEHIQTITIKQPPIQHEYIGPLLQLPAGRSYLHLHTPLKGVEQTGRRLTFSIQHIRLRELATDYPKDSS
jgi:hypothetical protein